MIHPEFDPDDDAELGRAVLAGLVALVLAGLLALLSVSVAVGYVWERWISGWLA